MSSKRGFDTTVTPRWSDLRARDKRQFALFIAEPDEKGCSAWQGEMRSGQPGWERIDRESRTRFKAQARRLLLESKGVELGDFDGAIVTCENPGCMSLGHVEVLRKQPQRITDEERQGALQRLSTRSPQCLKHPRATFRIKVLRQKSGNVTAWFKCIQCEKDSTKRRNSFAKRFKEERRDY